MDAIRDEYRAAIAAALAAWTHATPVWGKDDCALAIGNIDRAITGRDTAQGWRGRYRSAAGAARIMGKGGVLAMARKVARRWRWRSIPKGRFDQARDGDRGVARVPGGLACVIRYRGFWVGRHHGPGNILATDAQIVAAWGID